MILDEQAPETLRSCFEARLVRYGVAVYRRYGQGEQDEVPPVVFFTASASLAWLGC